MIILPDDSARISNRKHIDVDAALLKRQLEQMHLPNMVRSGRLEPRESRLTLTLVAPGRELRRDGKMVAKPVLQGPNLRIAHPGACSLETAS